MLLRRVVAALTAMIRAWGSPIAWFASVFLVIGLIIKARVTLAFLPEFASSLWFETTFAIFAGLFVHLTCVAVCIVMLAFLAGEQSTVRPLWSRAVGTFLTAVAISFAVVSIFETLSTNEGLHQYVIPAGELLGNIVLVPAYVLIFMQLAGNGDAGIAIVFRTAPTIIASILIVALGINVRQMVPNFGLSQGLLPLLPGYAVSAATTVCLLLLALCESKWMFAAQPETTAFD